MQQEARERSDDDDDDESESTDEDFNPDKENVEDVADEYDSNIGTTSSDSDDGSDDSAKARRKEKKDKKKTRSERNDRSERKESSVSSFIQIINTVLYLIHSTIIIQQKPRKKKDRDENKPKRATTAFMLWLNDTREKIKSDNPGITVTEIAKKGGEMWRELSDKSVRKFSTQFTPHQVSHEIIFYRCRSGRRRRPKTRNDMPMK